MAKIDFHILVISLHKLFIICHVIKIAIKVVQVQEDKEVQTKDSNSRGNAPIRKAPSKFKTKPEVAKEAPKAPKSPKNHLIQMKLSKSLYISNSGMCSRRDADIYIQSGNVKVNGW